MISPLDRLESDRDREEKAQAVRGLVDFLEGRGELRARDSQVRDSIEKYCRSPQKYHAALETFRIAGRMEMHLEIMRRPTGKRRMRIEINHNPTGGGYLLTSGRNVWRRRCGWFGSQSLEDWYAGHMGLAVQIEGDLGLESGSASPFRSDGIYREELDKFYFDSSIQGFGEGGL